MFGGLASDRIQFHVSVGMVQREVANIIQLLHQSLSRLTPIIAPSAATATRFLESFVSDMRVTVTTELVAIVKQLPQTYVDYSSKPGGGSGPEDQDWQGPDVRGPFLLACALMSRMLESRITEVCLPFLSQMLEVGVAAAVAKTNAVRAAQVTCDEVRRLMMGSTLTALSRFIQIETKSLSALVSKSLSKYLVPWSGVAGSGAAAAAGTEGDADAHRDTSRKEKDTFAVDFIVAISAVDAAVSALMPAAVSDDRGHVRKFLTPRVGGCWPCV